MRPERHADADLAHAAGHGVRQQAVESDSRQQQRQYAEAARQQCEQAFLDQHTLDLCGERADVYRRLGQLRLKEVPNRSRDVVERTGGVHLECRGAGLLLHIRHVDRRLRDLA